MKMLLESPRSNAIGRVAKKLHSQKTSSRRESFSEMIFYQIMWRNQIWLKSGKSLAWFIHYLYDAYLYQKQ